MKESGCFSASLIFHHLPGRDWEKTGKPFVRIAGLTAEIRTLDLQYLEQEC
jgi:hypothetical protein